MAMKCSALFLLLIQAGRLSSCVFDKVEKISGVIDDRYVYLGKNDCFAECYKDKSCIAFAYTGTTTETGQVMGLCSLFRSGNMTFDCGDMCYSLQRDEVDLTCQTYLNI